MTIASGTETDGWSATSKHRIGRSIFLVCFTIGAKKSMTMFLVVKAVTNNEFARAILH